jgi:uncharacterized membrane protein
MARESLASTVAVNLAVPTGMLVALAVMAQARPYAPATLIVILAAACYLHWTRTKTKWSLAGRLFTIFAAGMLGAMLALQFARGHGVVV